MKLLFRSAFRSFIRSPFQNIVLVLTVLLSAMLFSIIAETSLSVVEESESVSAANYGKANISVTADGDADSFYISSADVAAILDEGDTFGGYMVLPAYDDGGTALGAVTDFSTIGNIFSFSFTEYNTVTTANIKSAMFISSDFAESRSLKIGDAYTINVLGVTVEYVIQGINAHCFFGSYDFIVDAGGALDILSGISPVFAVFDGDNIPYSTVYVHTDGDVDEKIAYINASISAEGWSADHAEGSAKEYLDTLITILIPVIVLFTAVIAGILVYFSLNIISEKRKSQTSSFILAGMSPVKVALAFMIETSVYVAVGTLAGLGVSAIILYVLGVGRFEYATLSLKLRGALVCIAAEAVVEIVASLIYFIRSGRRRAVKLKPAYIVIIVSLVAVIACFALTYVVEVSRLFLLSIAAFIFVIALIFACIVPLCRRCAKTIAPRAEKSPKGRGVCLSLALKNSATTSEVHNVLRVLSVILSIIIVAVATLSYTSSLMQTYTTLINCDYIVVNADSDVEQEVAALEGTQNYCVCGIYTGSFDNGENFYVTDIGDSSFLNADVYTAEGNEFYMPKTAADLLGISVGDELTVEISGVECTLVLRGYTADFGIIGFFDAEYFGFTKNLILVQSEGEEYLSSLSRAVSVYGAFVQTPDSLFASKVKNASSIVQLLDIYLTFMCVIASVGAVNLAGVSYARRRQQFSDLITVGMTRADVAKMIAFEALIIFLFTAVISAACGAVLCFFLNNGMRSFGFLMF